MCSENKTIECDYCVSYRGEAWLPRAKRQPHAYCHNTRNVVFVRDARVSKKKKKRKKKYIRRHLIYQKKRFNLDFAGTAKQQRSQSPESNPRPAHPATQTSLTWASPLPLLQISIVPYASNTSFLVSQARWNQRKVNKKQRKSIKTSQG